MANPLGVGFKVKDFFFDAPAVVAAIDPQERKFLSKFGAFVRRRAKSSIKSGGKANKTSKPGEPPRGHTGLLRKNIFFGFDQGKKTVVVGPIIMAGAAGVDALEALEYGGSAMGREIIEAQGRDRAGRFTKKKRKLGKSMQVNIAARPFMNPAFEEEKKNIKSIWDSI